MQTITTREVDGKTVATLHDEHGRPAFHWIDCAPEGGEYREPVAAKKGPSLLRRVIGWLLSLWWVFAGFSVVGGLSALARMASH